MQSKPKYQAGDRVRVNVPGDIDNGKVFVVEGLSPSTQKKRSRYSREWRYGLIGSEGYFNESELTKIEDGV